jgi:hypothetical protein
MPRSRNANLWNFPGGISDWLGKGYNILREIKNFDSRAYNESTQIAFMQALRSARLTAGNPNAIQGRKILNSFAKVGFIDTSQGIIHLTQKGTDFLSATTNDEKQLSLRKACESMEFWNPIEMDMSRSFNVKPYPIVLYFIIRLGYLSNREIERHVLRIKNNSQAEAVINSIKSERALTTTYSPTVDEKNRAGWMMSLFGSTDLVRHWSGKLFPNSNNADKIMTIIKAFVPDAEVILEKEVDTEVNTEIGAIPSVDLDRKLGEILTRKSNIPRVAVRVVRKTNLYKREIELANLIKKLYDFKCQICGTQLKKMGWAPGMQRKNEWGYLYAETAHIKDIKHFPQYDVKENMLCLCSNCHKNLDNKVYNLSKIGHDFLCRDIITGTNTTLVVKPQHELTLFP